MWICDLVCDIDWLKDNKGHLGTPSVIVEERSELIQAPIQTLLFGHNKGLHHVRFVLHTDSQELAQKCVNKNINTWVQAIESGVMLQTKKSFSVTKNNRGQFIVILAAYAGGEHVTASIEFTGEVSTFDINGLGASLLIWNKDISTHLFYFRRMVDPAIPLDSRWHNAYKLFEWHFAKRHLKRPGEKKSLAQSSEWKTFVNNYQMHVSSYLKGDQTAFKLIENVRAMVAHAYLDSRSEQELTQQPNNLVELTYPVMNKMAVDLINSLKEPHVPCSLTSFP